MIMISLKKVKEYFISTVCIEDNTLDVSQKTSDKCKQKTCTEHHASLQPSCLSLYMKKYNIRIQFLYHKYRFNSCNNSSINFKSQNFKEILPSKYFEHLTSNTATFAKKSSTTPSISIIKSRHASVDVSHVPSPVMYEIVGGTETSSKQLFRPHPGSHWH